MAICDPDSAVELSYGRLKEAVDSAVATFSAAKLRKGDAVLFAAGNSAGLLVSMLAVINCGGIAVPINPDSTADEIAYYIDDSEAVLMVASEAVAARLQAASTPVQIASTPVAIMDKDGALHLSQVGSRTRRAAYEEDACLMIYTSGTTNRPKGVPLTHGNLLASVQAFAEFFQLTETDTTLVPMPYFHVHGLVGATFSTLYTGGTVVMQSRFSASKFWTQVVAHNVTWYSASPTIHRILLRRAAVDVIPRGQLRFIGSSRASLGVDTLTQLEEQFGTVVLEGYGMTESGNQVSCNPLPPRQRKPGSVGVAAGTQITIMDEQGHLAGTGHRGEIAIAGASVLRGYHGKPEANAAAFCDGWFRTGDEGYIDGDGYIYIVGRIKELINRGGEKISPAEVEEVLLRHPLVDEAACFGVFDAKYGEEVHAAIVLKEQIAVEEVMQFCGKHLSAIKVPKKVHVVEKIPRTPTNKVQRQQLAARFSND